MSWPATDFECAVQDELDALRARNEKLEKFHEDVVAILKSRTCRIAYCKFCAEMAMATIRLEDGSNGT